MEQGTTNQTHPHSVSVRGQPAVIQYPGSGLPGPILIMAIIKSLHQPLSLSRHPHPALRLSGCMGCGEAATSPTTDVFHHTTPH
ncbi:hypothetical protein E2C01_031599 [Portunus trituberculatus]|uniref:Uncharacterized protein n=1 Tax=Portunus trituberculatus TaxID=210409 RepID=A0A5B7EYJ6_PORTR|nr:hypothetical protein [Portunus trituberculatus]